MYNFRNTALQMIDSLIVCHILMMISIFTLALIHVKSTSKTSAPHNVYNLSLTCVEVTSGDERMTSETTESKLCIRPFSNVVEMLGRSWTLQLIMALGLSTSALRYSEIKKQLDEANKVEISDATLSRKLNELTSIGILLRESFSEIPPRVEYGLTQTGIQLYDRLCDLSNWAREKCHSGDLNIPKSGMMN